MKRSNLLILFIGVAIIFFGCTKDDSLAPDRNQNDQETYLKAKKVPTHFTGEANPLFPPVPNVNAWYDEADDDRVTGVSVWVITGMEPLNEHTTKMWGTAELFVGAEEVSGSYNGKWDMTWESIITLTGPDGSITRIVSHVVGEGTYGNVLELTARWKYSMVYDGTLDTFKYITKGKITQEF